MKFRFTKSTAIANVIRRAFPWPSLFADGTPGFRINVEEAIRLNKAAIGSKTSGFTPEELAACAIFQDSAGTLPVTAMEQPIGYIKDLSGNDNHFVQSSNTASRPIVSRRVNLLTASEQFDDAAWPKTRCTVTPNAALAPNGTLTADKLVEGTGGDSKQLLRFITVPSGVKYTFSISAKPAENSRMAIQLPTTGIAVIDFATGAVVVNGAGMDIAIEPQENGYYRVFIRGESDGSTTQYVLLRMVKTGTVQFWEGDGTSGVYIWGADFRLASDVPALPSYQRVTSNTDYDEVGFPAYASFDGLDDWLETGGTVDMTSTDEVTVIAGVTKLSDAAAGVVLESSSGGGFPVGGIAIYAPSAAAPDVGFRTSGNIGSLPASVTSGGRPSPVKALLTGIGRIGTDTAILRVNGAQAASSSANQGDGNYGNHKFYMGRRGDASIPFNGRVYGVTVVGKLLPDGQLAAAEQAERNLGRLY